MKKRDFLSLSDIAIDEARELLALAKTLKGEPLTKRLGALSGKAVIIIMERESTRTRVSFEIGVAQLGAHPVVLGVQGSQLSRGESLEDTAAVLGGYAHAIVFRTSTQERLTAMATAPIPVINALSNDGHPVQVLSDIFTIEEQLARPISDCTIAFLGDCHSNMARSWVRASKLFGFALRLGAPNLSGFRPPDEEVAATASTVSVYSTPDDAVQGCDVINTDVWTSMGQEEEATARRNALAGFTVTSDLVKSANAGSIVLHCLPAHRGEEIEGAVMDGEASRVWVQAHNRLHVQKALLLWLMGAA